MNGLLHPWKNYFKRWAGDNNFKNSYLIELETGGIPCISFDLSLGAKLDKLEVGDFFNGGKKPLYADIIPITFPVDMEKVLLTKGDDGVSWKEDSIVSFKVDEKTNEPFHTYLVSGAIWPIPKEEKEIREEMHTLESRHICQWFGDDIHDVGGAGCSHYIPTDDNIPPVFYLFAEGLNEMDTQKSPEGIPPGASVPPCLNAYMLPTILPNGTILWVAVKRDPNNMEENNKTLAKWTNEKIVYLGFNGETIFIDKLGITVLIVDEAKGNAKPAMPKEE